MNVKKFGDKYDIVKIQLGLEDDEAETMVLTAINYYLNNFTEVVDCKWVKFPTVEEAILLEEAGWVKLPTEEEVKAFIMGFRAAK